jgi:hypothetical protein
MMQLNFFDFSQSLCLIIKEFGKWLFEEKKNINIFIRFFKNNKKSSATMLIYFYFRLYLLFQSNSIWYIIYIYNFLLKLKH